MYQVQIRTTQITVHSLSCAQERGSEHLQGSRISSLGEDRENIWKMNYQTAKNKFAFNTPHVYMYMYMY